MRIHIFQHEPFEKPFIIEEWAKSKGAQISSTNFYKEKAIPNLSDIDWLFVMGGSMSVNDEKEFHWLTEEKEFIKKAIDAEKKVVGICLGAQLIADVLGSSVYPNQEKEIGWFPVKWTEEALKHSFFSDIPEQLMVMHWHGETFDLPAGAVLLASSEACRNQAFLFKNHVIGLQFHMEFNDEAIEGMLKNCGHELKENCFVQNKEDIVAGKKYFSDSQAGLLKILDALY